MITTFLENFFHSIFGDNVILATILIAIVPLIELKGAIPFAMSKDIWGAVALNSWQAFCFAFLGSIIIVPILALVFYPIYNWLKTKKFFNKIMDFLVGDVVTKSNQVNENAESKSQAKRLWLRILAVAVFVAFPVPLTGVWTGTCFAVLLGLNFGLTCVTVILGNAVCGLIVTFVCSVFPNATNILLYVFLLLVLVAVAIKIVLHVKHKKKAVESENA